MDFLIPAAWAASGQAAQQHANPLIQFAPLIGLLILFYFLLIRPQMKRSKEHRQLLDNLGKGDEVVTNGGVAGKICDLGDTFILIEIADGVQVRIQKGSVSRVLPKGTLDHL